jgi:hypothetical protein
LDNIPIKGDSRIKVFPHYTLQVVYLKPELIGAFETFELTCEFPMYSQGELEAEGESLSQVHMSDDTEFYKPQKVVQIPRLSHVWAFKRRNPDIGFIVVDGRHVGYFLRKKEALALEKMVLEHERNGTFCYSNVHGPITCIV